MQKLTIDELDLTLQDDEGLKIEFKERVSGLDRELVAFANASGSRLFVGVSDKGEIVAGEYDVF